MLSPYRVLDFTNERGFLCGQILADLGADVIVVEPPRGSPARRIGPFAGGVAGPESSLYWWAYNRNKRGITLNLEHDEGRAIARELVKTADFVIESAGPGGMDQRGLGYGNLSSINPGLVMVSISPFGQSGPKADWPASDLTVMASSGSLALTGDDDRPPVRTAVPQGFLHACADGAAGALIAHFGRVASGRGQHVDISAQQSAMMTTQSMILNTGWGEHQLRRQSGGLKLGPLTFRQVYPTSDGFVQIIFLFGSSMGPFTRRLMEWMYEEGAIDAATRDKDWINYVELLTSGAEPVSELERCMQCIEAFTSKRAKAELFAEALKRKLLVIPVNRIADSLDSAQLAAREFWQPVERNGWPDAIYPGPFAKFSRTPIAYRRPAPVIGEHNREVYGALGLDEQRQRELEERGIL